jgi:DNA polymerase
MAVKPKKDSAERFDASPFVPGDASIDVLREAAEDCRGCPLYRPATQTVFGEGPEPARIVFVGEQPGDQEDRQGRPFVGPAGGVLERALSEAGIDRAKVYVTNAVKHFKFEERGKRRIHKKPSTSEVNACSPWLAAEIRRLGPRVIVCLGATALGAVVGPGVQITRVRGMALESRFGVPAFATPHPSSVLRVPDPEARKRAYADLVEDLRRVAESLKRRKPASQAGRL